MSHSERSILVAREISGVVVRVEGRGTAHACPALREWIESELATGCDDVRIDLAHCTHLDSTFVGTLIFLAKRAQLKGCRLVLAHPSAECQQVLKQMCVQSLFAADCADRGSRVTDASEVVWSELSGDINPNNWRSFKQNVVQAHEELAGVPGPLSDRFRQIAETGKQELQDAQTAQGKLP